MHTKTLVGLLVVLLLASAARAQSIRNAVPDVARPLPLSVRARYRRAFETRAGSRRSVPASSSSPIA